MSYGLARDVLQQILRMIQGGLVGPHTHKANNGGPIQTDTTMQFRNALQPMFDTDSQILNPNLNADLWRGQRYFVGSKKPSSATIGDVAYDGITLYVWTGLKWLSLAGGGLSAISFLVNGGLVGAEAGLNLIQGSNVTITGVDNSGQGRVDVTITSTGGGGGAPTNAFYLLTQANGSLPNGVVVAAYPFVNSDIAAGAAIAVSKLAPGNPNYVLTMSGGVPTWQPAGAATTPSLLRNMIGVGS